MFSQQQQPQRIIDISLLHDYKLNTKNDWINWDFKHQEYQNIPLGYNNKFNFLKNLKYNDVSIVQQSQQDTDFVTVQESVRKKNKDFISKNIRMNQNKQAKASTRIYTKKQQRNQKPRTNQILTNFKKVTVKNDWTQIKTINKTTLDGLPQVKHLRIQNLKTIGKLNYLNPQVQRISWQQQRFKQLKTYTVDPIITAQDSYLSQIAANLIQLQSDRQSIICHPTFLLTLLTTKSSVFPWNIQIQKLGNLIVLQSYKSPDDQNQKLGYLDLYNINQNTSNNMPIDQSKTKQICINATKMSKIFKDLLASGQTVQKQLISDLYQNTDDLYMQKSDNQSEEQQEQQEQGDGDGEKQKLGDSQQQQKQQKQQEEGQQLDRVRKYIKISFQNYDIYTFVQIDGVKKNNTTQQLQYVLIRTFVQSQTQGAWIKQMKTPGAMTTKQYQSNTCSLQKWICQAKLAGVEEIKIGYIGYAQNKTPVILNVDQTSIKGLENFMSTFKYQNCWSTVKYIFGLFSGLESGNYILAKNPFTPLSIKLFNKNVNDPNQFNQEQQEQQQVQDQKNQQDKK